MAEHDAGGGRLGHEIDSGSPRQRQHAAAQAAVVSSAALPLGVFRVCWSALMVYSLLSTVYGSSELQAKFGNTSLNFRFRFADNCTLLRPTAGQATSLCLAAAAAAAAVGLGLPQPLHRLASVVLLALYSTLQLWEKSRYNNHYYLDCLLAGLFAATDAHAALSVDRALQQPPEAPATIPAWQLWAFRLQLLLAYMYGALAKLSSEDWIYRAQPMTGWLQLQGKWTPLHAVAAGLCQPQLAAETLGWVFSVGGVLFDLCIIVPLLLSTSELNPSASSRRRWRGVSWLCTLVFHGTNAAIFNIGTFPFMMIAANALFLMNTTVDDADIDEGEVKAGDDMDNSTDRDDEGLGRAVLETRASRSDCGGLGVLGGVVAAVWCAVQLMVPLRHHVYEGPVVWTGEGYHFSWMMVRSLLSVQPDHPQGSSRSDSSTVVFMDLSDRLFFWIVTEAGGQQGHDEDTAGRRTAARTAA